MLPTLNLDLSKICQSRIDLFAGGKTSFIGRTRCYHLDQLRDAARQSNENLDRFITKHLAAGMGTKPVKSELLFWFAAGNDLIWLTPCDKALRVGCWWMNEIPGYWESGREFETMRHSPIGTVTISIVSTRSRKVFTKMLSI